MSLADLSALVHYSRGYLSKVENGVSPPNRALAQKCDEALGYDGALVALVALRTESPTEPAWTWVERPVDLPPAAGSFLGRVDELAEIRTACSRSRRAQAPGAANVVVIHGMPGVGKTELAVQAAYQLRDTHPDGCLFLDLHGFSARAATVSAGDALDRVLRRLGVPGEMIPRDLEDRTALYRHLVRDRHLLIVFDNARSVGQVTPLLPPGGACDVIVTSRHRLAALDEAHHVALDVLSPADARELFRQLAGDQLRSGEAPLDESTADQIDRIMYRCGWLPLAVRVAAARYRSAPALPLADMVRQLDDTGGRLAALDDGERSVSAAFSTSCAALAEPQRRLFALLSAHPGGDFDRRAAAYLLNDADDASGAWVTQLLDDLLDNYLLVQRHPGRYAFHDLVRAFSVKVARSLVPTNERDAAVRRLVDGYVFAARQADVAVTPDRYRGPLGLVDPVPWTANFPEAGDAAEWLDAEQHNLVAICELAAERGMHTACWQLAYALRDFFFRTKAWAPWVRTHRLALDAARQVGDRWAEAVTLNNLGLGYAEAEHLDRAAQHYVAALALFRDLGDGYGEANTIGHQAWVLHCGGEHQAAIRRGLSALRFYNRHGVRRNTAITLRTIALAEAALGQVDNAVARLDQALEIFVGLRLRLDEAMTLNCLGEVHAEAGDLGKSVEFHRQAVLRSRISASRYEEARALKGLAAVAGAAGQGQAAVRLTDRAFAIHPANGVAWSRQSPRRWNGPNR